MSERNKFYDDLREQIEAARIEFNRQMCEIWGISPDAIVTAAEDEKMRQTEQRLLSKLFGDKQKDENSNVD